MHAPPPSPNSRSHKLHLTTGPSILVTGALFDALDSDHAQVGSTLRQPLGLLVGVRAMPALRGGEVLEFQHYKTGRLPVAFKHGELAARAR